MKKAKIVRAASSMTLTRTEKLHKLVDYLNEEGVSEHTMLEFFFDNLYSEDCYKMMKQLAKECDVDLEDFYTYVLKE